MKKLLLTAASAILALTATAQSAWDEIKQNPKLAAGKYMAYEAPEVEAAEPPEEPPGTRPAFHGFFVAP